MTANPLRTPEGEAFLSKLGEYRATLPAGEQRLLDLIVQAAGGTQDDVQGYVLFGPSIPFGGGSPFGGTVPYGAPTDFGAPTPFGSPAQSGNS